MGLESSDGFHLREREGLQYASTTFILQNLTIESKIMFIPRDGKQALIDLFSHFPILTVVGPRQSGKTTLVRKTFPKLPHYNLEDLKHREFAENDPVAFIEKLTQGAILDEIQRVPQLTSQIQARVDYSPKHGQFILLGSHQFEVIEKVSQSLAGRTAIFKLLPLSLSELKSQDQSRKTNEIIFKGFYPKIYSENISPSILYRDYVATYLERDLRNISEIRNLSSFRRFLKLCAGRIGQILDTQSLGNDCGVSHTTISSWLSILEASYVVYLLPPYFVNINKRLIKRPKLYFYDVGLASFLLDIETQTQIDTHPLRGALFENLIIMEILKTYLNANKSPSFHFYRDSSGNEIDLCIAHGNSLQPIEIKSGKTVTQDFFKGFEALSRTQIKFNDPLLIYDGSEYEKRKSATLVPLSKLSDIRI